MWIYFIVNRKVQLHEVNFLIGDIFNIEQYESNARWIPINLISSFSLISAPGTCIFLNKGAIITDELALGTLLREWRVAL